MAFRSCLKGWNVIFLRRIWRTSFRLLRTGGIWRTANRSRGFATEITERGFWNTAVAGFARIQIFPNASEFWRIQLRAKWPSSERVLPVCFCATAGKMF